MTALTLFGGKNLPAHVASFFEEESNITDRVTVPSLGYGGKTWTMSVNGEKIPLERQDPESGDRIPISIMKVVILDYAKRRGRAYYEGNFDPDNPGKPLCWSDDGVKPDASVQEKQHPQCEGCPMAVKGSRTTDNGKAVAACAQHRMLVVAPVNKLDMPLRMKIAITSDWDKQSPDHAKQGWFAFNNYTDYLRANGCQHTAALVTKMKFDPNVNYPKILFAADRWLDADTLKVVAPITKSEEVQKLLAGTWTPAGVDGELKDPEQGSMADTEWKGEAEMKAAQQPKPKATKPPAEDEGDGEFELPTTKPKATTRKPKAAVESEDGDEAPAPKPRAAKPAAEPDKPKAPATAAEAPAELASILADWGDE